MSRLAATLLMSLSLGALAVEVPEFKLVIENHRFTPDTVAVPAGKKVKLVVENKDATAEEFDSHDLNREKVITGNYSATIFIGPLKPGEYRFKGEFNEKTAKGVIVAK